MGNQSLSARSAIFDVDGTLALHAGRGPHEWHKAESDLPNVPVVVMLEALSRASVRIVYLSGRPEDARSITERWISKHIGVSGDLFLRASNDYRRDSIVKREIYESLIAPSHDVVAVFDDRDQVVSMWRNELGLTCFQVGYGDF